MAEVVLSGESTVVQSLRASGANDQKSVEPVAGAHPASLADMLERADRVMALRNFPGYLSEKLPINALAGDRIIRKRNFDCDRVLDLTAVIIRQGEPGKVGA